ncbi:MAG: regulatory protein RecX [Bacteroidales bacterium]
MPKPITLEKATDRAQWLCSQQEKCTFDIRKKLAQWGVEYDDIQKVIDSLLNDGFIDEKRYAVTFAREKARFNKWGPKKIEYALRSKRITDEHINQALEEACELFDMETLKELLIKKAKSVNYKNGYDLKMKLLRFGVSRGFEYDDIQKILHTILESDNEQ